MIRVGRISGRGKVGSGVFQIFRVEIGSVEFEGVRVLVFEGEVVCEIDVNLNFSYIIGSFFKFFEFQNFCL